jgi:hypothetical protein
MRRSSTVLELCFVRMRIFQQIGASFGMLAPEGNRSADRTLAVVAGCIELPCRLGSSA